MKIATFFDFQPNFNDYISKINKRRVWNNCLGPGIFPLNEKKRSPTFIREKRVEMNKNE